MFGITASNHVQICMYKRIDRARMRRDKMAILSILALMDILFCRHEDSGVIQMCMRMSVKNGLEERNERTNVDLNQMEFNEGLELHLYQSKSTDVQ